MYAASIGVAVLAAAMASPAPRPSLSATLGAWRLSEVGGKVSCTLNLTAQPGIGGLEVRVPIACRRAFPALKEVSTWSFDADGTIVLSDPLQRRILAFRAGPLRSYEARAPDGKVWRIEPAVLAPSAAATLGPGLRFSHPGATGVGMRSMRG